MAERMDYKKAFKELYLPKTKPAVVDVPEMAFIMVDGRGDPNTSPAYQEALELLYGLSFAIKMSKMTGTQPAGYFEYVVPPLEGLWWAEDSAALFDGGNVTDKAKFCWTAMIRQPEFVTQEVFAQAKQTLSRKKPGLDLDKARFCAFTEGLCAQVMHIGPYDAEPETIRMLERFVADAGYRNDLSDTRRHHEIYLGDPRRTAPERLKTVIRHPIATR